jgi:hypothetical protein
MTFSTTSVVKIGQYVFQKWDVILLLLSMTVVLGFELMGVFEHHYATITALTRTYIPTWLRVMMFSWLWWHMIIEKSS